jgi:DNA-binding GntR family transcriptional regulator
VNTGFNDVIGSGEDERDLAPTHAAQARLVGRQQVALAEAHGARLPHPAIAMAASATPPLVVIPPRSLPRFGSYLASTGSNSYAQLVGPPNKQLATRGRPGVVDDLAEAIQTRIISGDIPAGARLRQEQLAAEYELSRTPIREALRKLQAEGTVELVPNQGAVVRGTSVRDVREGYEVRAELEGMAAALAATWITDEHLTQLREAEELFRRAIEDSQPGTWARANDQFHEAVQAAAGNERLRRTIRDLHKAFPRRLTWGALEANSKLLAENVEQHNEILRAIESREPDAARDAMRRHVLRAGERITRWVERRGTTTTAH